MIFKKSFPHYIQLEQRDCGATCLQMLCKYYGCYFEIDYLRQLTGTRKEGITAYDFIKAAEQVGLRCLAFRVSYRKFRDEVPLPCVVHWRGHHYIVVYKITKSHIYVSDPAVGPIKYTLKEFAEGWLSHSTANSKGTRGVCLVAEPTSLFKKEESQTHRANYIEALNFIWGYVRPYKKNVTQILIILGKFAKSERTGELIGFVSRHSKTRKLMGVREDSRFGKQICVLSEDLKGKVEPNVLYSVELKPMHKANGYVVVAATPVLFPAQVETVIIPKSLYQVTVTFGNKKVFFDPKDGKSAMSRTIEGVLSVLQSRKDIKDQEGVISDYLHQAKALVRRLEADGFIYVDSRRNG